MRNFVKFSMLALVAFATTASAAELEFHGYARAGFGFSDKGTTQLAYGLNSADTKFRLGNETDYVVEPDFEIKFATLEDKSAWGVNAMPGTYRRFAESSGTIGTEFKQIYFFGSNVSQLLGGEIWAGRRYIERFATGINDQFLENEDGDGAGIQDMNLGFAKWTVNVLANPTGFNGPSDNNIKIATRLTGIQTFSKDAALQVWLRAYVQKATKAVTDVPANKRDTGYTVGVYHTWNLGDLGSNLIGVKYEKDNTGSSAAGAIGYGKTGYRVVVQHGFMFTGIKTSLDVLTEYRSKWNSKGSNKDKDNWFALGARTDSQLSGPFRLLLEAGYDYTKNTAAGAKANSLVKGTVCFAVSGGNDPWSRPTFRVFATAASWNKEAYADMKAKWINGDAFGQAYPKGTETSGLSYGVQAEGWW